MARPARRGARHDRFHCAGLDAVAATMPGPRARGLRMERPGAAGRGRSNAGAHALQSASMKQGVPCEARKREAGSGGRFKCMSGRQSVRTRRRVDKSDNSWGHAADRSNPSACGTQAFPASEAAISPCASRTGLPRVSFPWGRGRVERPCVPHAPSGEMRKTIEFQDRRALEPDKTRGDDACLIVARMERSEIRG